MRSRMVCDVMARWYLLFVCLAASLMHKALKYSNSKSHYSAALIDSEITKVGIQHCTACMVPFSGFQCMRSHYQLWVPKLFLNKVQRKETVAKIKPSHSEL